VFDVSASKIKILMVVGCDSESDNLACCYINSEVNLNVIITSELKGLQYKLCPTDYDFLHHDSHLDCSKLVVHKKPKLLSIITETPKACLGELKDGHRVAILNHIKRATTISKYKKEAFGLM